MQEQNVTLRAYLAWVLYRRVVKFVLLYHLARDQIEPMSLAAGPASSCFMSSSRAPTCYLPTCYVAHWRTVVLGQACVTQRVTSHISKYAVQHSSDMKSSEIIASDFFISSKSYPSQYFHGRCPSSCTPITFASPCRHLA
jgi:hypothetical protein